MHQRPNLALWGPSSPKSPEKEAVPNSIPRCITSSLCKAPCALGRKMGRILSQMGWADHSLIHSLTQSVCICAAPPLYASWGMQRAESRHQTADHNAHRDITWPEGGGRGEGGDGGPGDGVRRGNGQTHQPVAAGRTQQERLTGCFKTPGCENHGIGKRAAERGVQRAPRGGGGAGRGSPDPRGDTFFPGRQNLCGNQERGFLKALFLHQLNNVCNNS